jgi:hypothetical protein
MYDENDSLPCSFLTRHCLLCFFCRIVRHPSSPRISRSPLIGYISGDRTVDCPYRTSQHPLLPTRFYCRFHLELNCLVGRAVILLTTKSMISSYNSANGLASHRTIPVPWPWLASRLQMHQPLPLSLPLYFCSKDPPFISSYPLHTAHLS